MAGIESQTERVHVALADRSYDILVGSNLLASCAHSIQLAIKDLTHAICIADESISASFAQVVRSCFDESLIRNDLIRIESGEKSKSVSQLVRIWEEMLGIRADRGSVVVAIGGGVIGDLAGFAAATYARGIRLIQIPTTLLSQVDSSVGGKTGINLPQAKNIIGSFWQPSLVLIDTDTLSSLPRREYLSGLAEAVKYGVIMDADLFDYMEQNATALVERDSLALRKIVVRSCQLKAQVVADDERETTGRRAILNYGHTFAHALEAGTEYGQLLHGEAVSIGMVMASQLAAKLKMIPANFVDRQKRLLESLSLPTEYRNVPCTRMWELMQHDKKVHNGRIGFILPTRLGQVQSVGDIDQATVLDVLRLHGVPD